MPLNTHLLLFFQKIHFILLLSLLWLYLIPAKTYKFHFKDRPKNHSVIIGSDILLSCSIAQLSGNTPFQIQWLTNKEIILSYMNVDVIPGFSGRYRFVKDTNEELHLSISNLTLDDDGVFQCQVIGQNGNFIKSSAFVNVLGIFHLFSNVFFFFFLFPPRIVRFPNYPSGSALVVIEGSQINLTCISEHSKPQSDVNIYFNGLMATENVIKNGILLKDGTFDSVASLLLRPSKLHHNNLITCESNHAETFTKIRDQISLDVYYSSDRPKIDLIGATNDSPLIAAEGGNPPPHLLWSSNKKGQLNSTFEYDETTKITQNELSFIVSGVDNDVTFECMSQTHQNITPLLNTLTLHVDYPPANVFLYGNTVVRKGESLTMSCTSSVSSPASTITWQINGSPTKKQIQTRTKQLHGFVTQSNISIDSTMLLHGQNQILIACIASNAPPSQPIIVDNENIVPLEGVLYNLTCESQGGHPFATLSWFRGVEKNSGKHFSSELLTHNSLQHSHHKKKIKWKQLKEAENSLNGDSSISKLTLLLDRSMNEQQIRCEAENGATDLPLIAKKKLIVLFPPVHVRVKPTRNVHMIANSPTEFSCSVPSSNPMAELSWELPNAVDKQLTILRNGEQIRKSSKPIGEYYGYESENIIQFTPTEGMDGAEIRCIASHHLWNDKKYGNYALDIKYPPRQSFEENVTIYANPRVNAFAWRKDGFTIDRSIGSIFVRQSVIGGIGITKEDTGIYTLLVSNGVGTANATISLIVEYSARITRINNPVIASSAITIFRYRYYIYRKKLPIPELITIPGTHVGEDIVLECEADGRPLKLGMIKWFRGLEEVKPFVLEQHRSALRIIATHENSGAYTCLVDNGIGQPNSSIAYLLVRRAPEVVKNPSFNRAAGPIGGKATLRCRANAVPNAEFNWSIEGEGHMIHHNTTKYRFFDTQMDYTTFQSTLTILNLDEKDYTRRYRCRVSNRLGLAHTFISVGPPSPPEQPSELEIINISNTSASISWVPGFDGGSDQLFELLYQDMEENQLFTVNTSLSNIVLTDLKIKHGYSIQIRAINSRGDISDFTQPLFFKTVDEMSQNAGIMDNMFLKKRPLSHSTIIALCFGLLLLILLNICLICYLNRRNKHRKIIAKSSLSNQQQNNQNNNNCSSSSGGSGGSVKTIQIYGTMAALQQHQGQLIQGQQYNVGKNGSNSNCSDFNITQQDIEETQSARTMIVCFLKKEAPSYNHFNGGQTTLVNPNNFYHNSTCVINDDHLVDQYSQFQRPNVNFNTAQNIVNYSTMEPVFSRKPSYQAYPNPEPYGYAVDGRYSSYAPSTTSELINGGGVGNLNSNNNSLQRNRNTLMSTFYQNNNGGFYDSSTLRGGEGYL
ncbi:hypothetical protein Mgra_00006005 [Meloidogyne graminicola]|uniref:Nephrin n=1 Tax=Meloidogyne graminicola TaxID=189291 RepID=A0A8S9ZM69_9BILA|nr:hypothetical protein Mgra_00006005 [Meloidogyne graminicola]